MAEELDGAGKQDNGAPTEKVQPPETPSADAASSSSAEDLQAQVAQAVKDATAEIRGEFEGKGGRLAKLQQEKDKEIATLRQQLQQTRGADIERANALMAADNPAEAAAIYQRQAAQMQQQVQADGLRSQWGEWVQGEYEKAGVEAEGDEVGNAVDRLVQGSMNQTAADDALAFQSDLYGRALEQKEKAMQEVAKQLTDVQASIPEMVKQEVTRSLAGAGFVPEATPGQTGALAADDDEFRGKSADMLIAEGIATARKKLEGGT